MALLGKQVWRLITQPSSLVTHLYKARYFPKSNFLDAQIGSNPSYVWRSILEAQNLVRSGAAVRVGAGTSVSIINDPWLPSDDPYIETRDEWLQGKQVAHLLRPDTNQWNMELLGSIFGERDLALIAPMPIDNEE